MVTDFKTRVLRLKPEVHILGSPRSIRHTKVEILRLKSYFLHKKETKLSRKMKDIFFVGVRNSFTFFLVLKFPFVSLEPQCLPECLPLSHQVFDPETMRGKCRTYCLPKPSLKIIHGTPI